jgi:hypothetical protein
MSDINQAATEAPPTEAAPPSDKPVKEKKVRVPKEAAPPPVPVAAEPTPLADRAISEKKLGKLNENLRVCMEVFEGLRAGTESPNGLAVLAGRGALPNDTPEGFQPVSLAESVIQGRRVSGTLFSTRLKNLLIQQYSPMQVGPWLLFKK